MRMLHIVGDTDRAMGGLPAAPWHGLPAPKSPFDDEDDDDGDSWSKGGDDEDDDDEDDEDDGGNEDSGDEGYNARRVGRATVRRYANVL